MSEVNEQAPRGRRNPLTWIAIIIVGLILFVFLGGDRRSGPVSSEADEEQVTETVALVQTPETIEEGSVTEDIGSTEGTIERSVILPPGMRAREYIKELRAAGEPYPLEQIFSKAQDFQHEGSLADAHLLYFFAARENHLPAVMMMAQLSDPVLFQAENSLLDEADPIQAYKWYSKAADLGQPTAADGIRNLRQWAQTAAADGDAEARQLLLNIE